MSPPPCLDESTFMDLLMGTLPPERATQVDEHLDACVSCRRMVSEALKVHAPDAPPDTTCTHASTVVVTSRGGPLPPRGMDAPLPRGTAVGRYLVLERLGTGGMGVVYAAYDPELDRRIALKLLRSKALGLDADKARAHLLHEAQAMARVSHPNVVPVYDVGTFRGQVFLAMELVDAQTLRQWLKEAPRPWRQVRDVLLQAGRGLAAAHAAGIIHGDVKPENILVGKDGRVRVTDFGLARTATVTQGDDGSPRLSGGTPAYMAPEQFLHEGYADALTDQFSFCAALHEALYGERPFAGETVEQLREEVTAGRVRPSPRGTGVPPWLRRVTLRGLSTRPEERHPSLAALLAALQADPAARIQRRLRFGGGVLLLLLCAVGVTHLVTSHASRVCEGAERELSIAWGPEQQSAVKSAFLGTGKPFAAAAWMSVQQTLDAYGAAWATTRTAACKATRVRGEQPEAVMAQRMRCLDLRLAELAALTRLFAEADAELVEHAPRAVKSLTPLAACSDGAVLASHGPAPIHPEARRRAERLREALARARALKAAGRYAQAAALLEPVAWEVEEAGERQDAADALLLLAELRDRAGDYAGAESAVFDALWAAEAGRNDEAAARAWTLAVRIAGELREQYADAERWRQRAEAAIERLGGDAVLRARLAFHVGGMRYSQGRFAEAAEQYEAAIPPLERAFGPESLEVADVRIDLGSARLAQGNPDEALRLLERALEDVRRAVGPHHPEVARVLLELARARWQRHELKKAETLAREALELLEHALGPEHPQVGNALNLLGAAVQYQAEASDEALPLFERALRIAEKSDGTESSYVAVLISNYANALTLAGRHEEAMARFTQALKTMERKLGPEHPNLVPVLRSMGQMLQRQKRYPEALPYFQRAVDIQLAQDDDIFSGWTGALVDLGGLYLKMKQWREAQAPLERALAGWEKAKTTQGERATIHYYLGKALWDGNLDRPRALRLVSEARKLALRGGPPAEPFLRHIDNWLASLPREALRAAEEANASAQPPR